MGWNSIIPSMLLHSFLPPFRTVFILFLWKILARAQVAFAQQVLQQPSSGELPPPTGMQLHGQGLATRDKPRCTCQQQALLPRRGKRPCKWRVKAARAPGQRCQKHGDGALASQENKACLCPTERPCCVQSEQHQGARNLVKRPGPGSPRFIHNVFLNSDHHEHVLCELKLETLCPFPIWKEYPSPVKIPQTASYEGKLFLCL